MKTGGIAALMKDLLMELKKSDAYRKSKVNFEFYNPGLKSLIFLFGIPILCVPAMNCLHLNEIIGVVIMFSSVCYGSYVMWKPGILWLKQKKEYVENGKFIISYTRRLWEYKRDFPEVYAAAKKEANFDIEDEVIDSINPVKIQAKQTAGNQVAAIATLAATLALSNWLTNKLIPDFKPIYQKDKYGILR